jgi:vancomycin resistance protein VanW
MKAHKIIPAQWRRQLQIIRRSTKDRLSGTRGRLALHKKELTGFTPAFTITQPIMPGPFFENKVHNIQTGAQAVNEIVIAPGQIFSFWYLLGFPSAKNGYLPGRNIIDGKVQSDYGGGLCQLASILYHTALTAGLTIAERHHHSIDIYKEADRFTPLGADAAVVYGYKDLRFKNTSAAPVSFDIHISENELHCRLLSTAALSPLTIVFERDYGHPVETVETVCRPAGQQGQLGDPSWRPAAGQASDSYRTSSGRKVIATSVYRKASNHCPVSRP